LEVEWKKPLLLPSPMVLEYRVAEDKRSVTFDMTTPDGLHQHLSGVVKHVPAMKLTKH
jgi:hypothetical protein